MPAKNKRKLAIVLVMLVAILAGCGPEAGRPRGAGFGTGADVDNHPAAPEQVMPNSKIFAAESKP